MYGILQEMHDATLTGCVTLSHAQKSLTKQQKIKHLNAPELSFESNAKGCEYLFTCAFFFFLIYLQRFESNFFHVVNMGYCLWNAEENNQCKTFWNKAVT